MVSLFQSHCSQHLLNNIKLKQKKKLSNTTSEKDVNGVVLMYFHQRRSSNARFEGYVCFCGIRAAHVSQSQRSLQSFSICSLWSLMSVIFVWNKAVQFSRYRRLILQFWFALHWANWFLSLKHPIGIKETNSKMLCGAFYSESLAEDCSDAEHRVASALLH